MVWLKRPVLITTNTGGDVATSHQRYLAFVAENMAGNCPEIHLENNQCKMLERSLKLWSPLSCNSTSESRIINIHCECNVTRFVKMSTLQ